MANPIKYQNYWIMPSFTGFWDVVANDMSVVITDLGNEGEAMAYIDEVAA